MKKINLKKMNIKKLILLFIVGLTINSAISQQNNRGKSKMLDFVSKTGVIIKFEDYNLSPIKSSYVSAKTKIRKIISGSSFKYFFQISIKKKYTSKTASIAYEDLMEIIKAITKLKEQSNKDTLSTSDYLENIFITDDGFKIGYYVSKAKLVWYVQLDRNGSDNTLFIKDITKIENAFKNGKNKIEKLKE